MRAPTNRQATRDAADSAAPDRVRAGSSSVSVQVVASLSELAGLAPDYERLQRVTGNPLPFALHEWHQTWCTHFLNLDPHIADRPLFLVLRDQDGACVAIVPLIFSRRRFGPVNTVSIDLLGGDPSSTESRAPLVERGYEHVMVQTVRLWLAREQDWDWMFWGAIAGEVGDALAECSELTMHPEAPGYVLDLAPTWEEFRAGLKRNIRESLRHCYNSLRRDGHELAMEIVSEPGAMRGAVARFLELHAMRAQLANAVPHHNHFASQVSRQFLYDVCERLAVRGSTRIFQLRIGNEIVASRIGFVVADSLFLYYSGFDPSWSRYSVMTTTVAEALKYAISTGLKTVNLSRGTDQSKTRWGPRIVEYRGALERRDRLRSRIAHACSKSLRSGKGISSWILRPLGRGRRVWG